MEFTIFSIGDSEFLEQVLIALAMIGGVDDFGAMVQVGLLLGVFITIVSAIANGGRGIDIQHVLLGYILWATMFIPTARVTIEDTYTGDLRVVDNVPAGPAAAGGIISLIGYKVTELFEVAYAPIVPKITETEFAESLKILIDVRNVASTSAVWRGLNQNVGGGFVDLRRSWANYIKDCTLKKIDLGLMSPDELNTGSYMDQLEFNSLLFGTRIYNVPGDGSGVDLNCTDAWDQLNADTQFNDNAIDAFNAVLGFDSSKLPPGQTSATKTQTALDALLGAGVESQTYMQMAVLEPIVMLAASGKYDQLQHIAGSSMVNQAIQQRNTTWAAEQTLFMTIVRPMLAFFEAFIYAVAPIMAFVIVLGQKGLQLAAKYFTMLIWIQLWMPLLSIINLYIYTAASRKMATYALMSSHNWDSFYALHTAADTMQTWIATGGLLASSTPAIALMLIYGSSVTATHLAGRLRAANEIDDKYLTPDLRNNAPVANVSSMYSGDTVGGMVLTGAQGTLGSATMSSVLSRMTQSGQLLQNTESETFSNGLAHSLNSSSNAAELFAKASVAGAAAKSGHSTISQNAMQNAHAFMDTHKIDHSHADAITGIAGLSASLGAKLDVDQAATYMAGAFGVSKAAATKFLQDAGAKDASEGDLSPGKGKGKGEASLIDVDASASATFQSASRTSDQSQNSYGQQTQSGGNYTYSDQEQAQFAQELSSHINRQNSQNFQNTWGTSDAMSIQRSASELVSATQSYNSAAALQASLGSASSIQMRTIGALAAGRDQAGMQGNSDAQKALDAGWNSQPEAAKTHAQDLYSRYASWGMPSDVARNTARLTALTDSNNFKDNPTGYLGATMLAAEVIRKATGVGGTAHDFDYDKNSSLDKPSFNTGDIRQQASNLAPPDNSSMGKIRNEAVQPNTNVYSEQGQLPIQQLQDDHGSHVDGVRSTGAQREQSLIDGNEQRYRDRVQHAPDMSTSARIWGAYDNTTGWVGRRADELAGGTEAFVKESLGSMGGAYEAYKHLTPEQAQTFRSSLAEKDGAMFDSLGIAGLPVKGSQVVGNHIMGAAVAGVDAAREWVGGKSDLSEAARGMSIQERGAFFAAASVEAANQGADASVAFWNQYGDEFKSTMEQIGQTQYGLTPKQAAIFAESFDTNDSAMHKKVMDFQSDYAEKDASGNPQWDSWNNQWAMTPENREFSKAVVDRIVASTSAGDRVGSYLEPISGYNVATRTVTPNQEK